MRRLVKPQIHGARRLLHRLKRGQVQVGNAVRLPDLRTAAVVLCSALRCGHKGVIRPCKLRLAHKRHDPARIVGKAVFHLRHAHADVHALLRVDLARRDIRRYGKAGFQHAVPLAGERVPVAFGLQPPPSGSVIVLPYHGRDRNIVRLALDRALFVDDRLRKVVLRRLFRRIVHNRRDVQPQVGRRSALGQHCIRADIKQRIRHRLPAEAIAALRQFDRQVTGKQQVCPAARKRRRAQADSLNRQRSFRLPRAADTASARLIRIDRQAAALFQHQPAVFRPHRIKREAFTLVQIGPLHFLQKLGAFLFEIARTLPQLNLHRTRAVQPQHILLTEPEAVALQVFPAWGKEALRPRQVGPFQPVTRTVDVKNIQQARRRSLDHTFGFVNDVVALPVRRKHLRACRHAYRLLHGFMRGELHRTRCGSRGRQAESNQVEELSIQLFRQGIDAVDRLLKHPAEQFGQRRARVILCILKAPFRRIGCGKRPDLPPQLFQRARIQRRGFHSTLPPSEPSVM